jgi:hypothetical protein
VNEWAVADFVSRVAERVSTAGEGLAAQLIDRYPADVDVDGSRFLSAAFPSVEPPAEFIRILRQNLLDASILAPVDPARSIVNDRRVVYGVAAFGSIASAAVVAMFFLRFRAANRPAA